MTVSVLHSKINESGAEAMVCVQTNFMVFNGEAEVQNVHGIHWRRRSSKSSDAWRISSREDQKKQLVSSCRLRQHTDGEGTV